MQVKERSKLRLTRTGVMILFALLVTSVATPAMLSALAEQTEVAATDEPNDAKPEDEPTRGIFTPEPVWQTKLAASDTGGGMSRVSPVVVVGNRVLTVGKDFDLATGDLIKPSITRPVETDAFGLSLTPIYRRHSSDRAFVLEVSHRVPGNTGEPPSFSFEMRVFRAADGTQVGRSIQCKGAFIQGWAADVESRGNFVLLGDQKSVRVYRVETGEIETTLPVPIKRVDAVAFSPDQEWLVVSDQNDLHFWR